MRGRSLPRAVPEAYGGRMSEFWDQRFGEPGYKYGIEPNEFLREQEPRLPRGARVLVPGDGEGRNGVWLAQQGHRVVTVDSSRVGVAKAAALAEARGVAVERVLADLVSWTPVGSFDAVVLCFVHFPSAVRPAVHRRLAAALAPGGLLVLEAFHPRQLGNPSGGPKDVDMLFPLEALRSDFAGLGDELVAEERLVQLDEGPGHRGPGFVTRLLLRRR